MKTLFLLLLLPVCLWGQNVTIEGMVTDSTGAGLPSASVVLLQGQDSVLSTFCLTNDAGKFSLKRVEPGAYVLQISYLGFDSHWQTLNVQPSSNKMEIGNISLTAATAMLSAVEIKADRTPLSMRKDTLEYNAASFKTQPGAVVEDLLRKMPGIQVQADGTIKAQGKTVQNVLVDGKEFFGQDPKIATKNLPADAINKVQVFDKKSEAAEFTGIEDGRDERTINLKLKDDKKQGYFGNASLGVGTENRYEGKFNVNRFGRRTQMSAIGMANNNNQQGFSFQDYINFMGGIGNFMSGGGGRVRMAFNIEDGGVPMGPMLDRGFTNTQAGGLNLNSDLSRRTSLSANYFYNNIQNDIDRSSTRENLLGTNLFGSTETENRLSRNTNHRLHLTLKHKIDSFQNLTFRSHLTQNDGLFRSNSVANTFDAARTLQNSINRNYTADGKTLKGDASLTYRRRLGRKGRALVGNASFKSGNERREGSLRAANDFYLPISSSLIHQRQNYRDEAGNYAGSIAFTEPIGNRRYLEFRVEHQQYLNNTIKDFYDRFETPTPGEVFNPLLSNQFRRGYRYEKGGLNWMINRKKYNLTAGAAVQHAVLDGEQLGLESPIKRNFTRVLPNLYFNYDFKTSRNLTVDYTADLREPSLEQLQPAADNSDPLNVYIGNPNLKPEYAHNLGVNFMNFDQFSLSSVFVSLNTTFTKDRITNSVVIDSLFRRTIRPINVSKDLSMNGYASFNTPLRFIKTNLNARLNSTYNRSILWVNAAENTTDRWLNSLEVSFDNRKKEKMDWTIGADWTQNSTRYSVSKTLNQAFFNQRYFGEITVFPNKKWAVGTGLDATIYSQEQFGERRTVPLWRANITRYILKNNKGQLKLSAFDLLNRNVGISRSSQFNYYEEERVRNLGRYVMVSFAYSLAGFKREKDGIEINL